VAKILFAVSGGAIKAYAFHLGVAQAMQAAGFHFRSGLRWRPDTAPTGALEVTALAGSSAGACVAASLASGHSPEEQRGALLGTARRVPHFNHRVLFQPALPSPRQYLKRLIRRYRAGLLRPSHLLEVGGGLFTTAGVERYFRESVLPTNCFSDLAAELFITATQVNNSRKVIFGPRDSLAPGGYDPYCAYYDNVSISRAMAASTAVPPVFAPFAIASAATGKTFHYYDGEIRETLSVHIGRDVGADFVIASSIWRPYHYDPDVGSLAELGMAAVLEQVLHQIIEQKVSQYQRQSVQHDLLLEAIRTRDHRHEVPEHETERFLTQVQGILRHRSIRYLYVVPDRSDHQFFFSPSFRFSADFVDHCMDVGRRAFRRAVRENPGFMVELRRAHGSSTAPWEPLPT
jgi:predicted acylesterase/phospholipase RssA